MEKRLLQVAVLLESNLPTTLEYLSASDLQLINWLNILRMLDFISNRGSEINNYHP